MLARIVLISGFLLFLAGALSIPVFYGTTTLWYKYGVDRFLLYAGQYAGILALVFLYLQVILATRGPFLEYALRPAQLMQWHRRNALFVGILAFSHIVLILFPEGLDNLPLGAKYWPEMLGVGLFFCLFFIILTALYRQRIKVSHKTWRLIHRFLAYMILIFAHVHVFFVSDSFEQTVPQYALIASFSLLCLWIIWTKFQTQARGKS